MDLDEVSKAYSAYQTVLEMLEDRGYYISKDVKDFSKDSFSEKYRVEEGILTIAPKRYSQENIIVHFIDEKRAISHKSLESMSIKMKEHKIYDGIIVSSAPMSPSAEKLMQDLDSEFGIHFEYFNLKELIVNITKHDLVPKHEMMETEETQKLLERFRCKLSQLPKILVTDPVAKYYGMRRGQVVKILRRSETAGTYVTYRYVV